MNTIARSAEFSDVSILEYATNNIFIQVSGDVYDNTFFDVVESLNIYWNLHLMCQNCFFPHSIK